MILRRLLLLDWTFVARLLLSTLAALLVAACATDANAFAVLDRVFDERGALDVTETLMTTGRWSVDEFGGLSDGVIDVAIQPDLAERLGVTDPGQKAAVEQAVVDGVLLWSSPALSFDVTVAPPDGTPRSRSRLRPTRRSARSAEVRAGSRSSGRIGPGIACCRTALRSPAGPSNRSTSSSTRRRSPSSSCSGCPSRSP
jgi:hypothetical protein